MFVELHIIQNFAPSNLNRDDTGAPKSCMFGGYLRARISSQCIKRAIRREFRERNLLNANNLGIRTRRLAPELARRFEKQGKGGKDADSAAENLLKAIGLSLQKSQTTEYLVFVGEAEVTSLVEVGLKYWDQLVQGKVNGGLKNELKETLKGGKAVDVALFGRMVADQPEGRIDAACQVSHAISTHQVVQEVDYFTAVDDLQPRESTGAGMIGLVEFNSACFYRYSCLVWEQLVTNLDQDKKLALGALEAFLRASVQAVPSGKQNSFAAHNPPSLVFSVVRESHPWSLANAFVDPVRPRDGSDIVRESIQRIFDHWDKLCVKYGSNDVEGWFFAIEDELPGRQVKNRVVEVPGIDDLVRHVLSAVQQRIKD